MEKLNIKFPENLEGRICDAIKFFWNTRNGQITKQAANQIHDQGNRGAVTGGKQMDGFVGLIKNIIIENGISESNIFCDTDLELPGYYRPNKKWDLLVVNKDRLLIAIEFKSQVGPSFGNNFNNRTEEAMGNALDIWTAYREGVFGKQQPPWLGYIMVLEDCNKSTCPVSARSPHFDLRPEFINASYRKRYELFCEKLVLERQYASTCLLTTKYSEKDMKNYKTPVDELSFVKFISSMLGTIYSYRNGD